MYSNYPYAQLVTAQEIHINNCIWRESYPILYDKVSISVIGIICGYFAAQIDNVTRTTEVTLLVCCLQIVLTERTVISIDEVNKQHIY